MKLVLLFQFLSKWSLLFNVWWIAWNVFVPASANAPPAVESEHMTSGSELNGIQSLLTSVVHLLDTTSKTVVTVHEANASVSFLDDQTSATSTSTKSLLDGTGNKAVGEGVTIESSLFGYTTNEEVYSREITAQTENGEAIVKNGETKNVTIEVVHYDEETSTTSSTDESGVTRINYQQSGSQRETSGEEDVTKEATSAMSKSGENSGEQISLLHSQSSPLPLLSTSVASKDKTVSVVEVRLDASLSEPALSLTWKIQGASRYSRVSFGDEHMNVSNRSFVFRNLIPGQTYTASVAVCDEQLRCSNPENVTNNTYPMPPQNVSITKVGANLTVLQWDQFGVASNFSVIEGDSVNQRTCIWWSTHGHWNSTEIYFSISQPPPTLGIVMIEACSGELCKRGDILRIPTDPMAPINISSVNATSESVTLQWFQDGVATSFSVNVTTIELGQGGKEPKSWNDIFNADGKIWNWTWVSFIIPDLPTAGINYSSIIKACHWGYCEHAPYQFQTAPSDPVLIKVCNISIQSATVSWVQKGAANNFNISVSDKSANLSWIRDQEAQEKILAFIDRLSTPGQLVTVTIAALSGLMRSNSQQITFNTKPSKPGFLFIYECLDNLCVKWNQSGIFDSYNIRLNGSRTNFSCSNLLDATNNLMTTVECTLYHDFSPGSLTTLSVVVKSGNQTSDEVTEDYVKSPDMPQGLHVVTANTSTVCFSWNQTGSYDRFDFRVSLHNHSSQENLNISMNSIQPMDDGFVQSCVNDLPCPGAVYSLQVAAVSHGRKSYFQILRFRSAPADPVQIKLCNVSMQSAILCWVQKGAADNFDISVSDESANVSWIRDQETEEKILAFIDQLSTPGQLVTVTITALSGQMKSNSQLITFNTNPSKPGFLFMDECLDKNLCMKWNQSGIFDSYNIRLNGSQANFSCSNSSDATNDLTTVECTVHHDFSPGSLTTLSVVVKSGNQTSDGATENYVKRPDMPQGLHVVTANTSTVCFSWNQTGSYDGFNFSIYLHNHSSQEHLNISMNSIQLVNTGFVQSCVNCFNDLPCPGAAYSLQVAAVSHGKSSNFQDLSFHSELNSPTGLRILEISSTNMRLSWTSPAGCVADFLVQCSGQHNAKNDSRNVTENNGKCENLTPGALYCVTVSSWQRNKAAILLAESEAVSFVTVPLPPSNVTVWRKFVNTIQLTVKYSNSISHCTDFRFQGNGINETKSCKTDMHNLTSLKSNTCYNISVSTISVYCGNYTGNRTSANSTVVSVWTLPQAIANLSVNLRTLTSLKLSWNQPDDSVNGIHGYSLMLQNTSGYQQNITLNCHSPELNCTDGWVYCEVKNLFPSQNYTITIQAINLGGASDEQVITAQTLDPPVDDTLLLLLAGLIIVILLIIVLTAAILFLLFRKKTKFAVPSSKRPSDAIGFPNPSFSLGMESAEICERMKPQPIPLDKFIEHLEELHNDSDFLFSSEYALLTELSPKHPQTAAELEDNRIKNRYSNILPFDHSRVKLIPLDDDDQGSDYINASYMPGYVSKREFIAAQGPMKSTVDDFWRMIWEQHIITIVMVTNLQERGREKCAEYWPTDEEPIFYGDLQVQLKSESQLNYYIIRILDVKLGEKKRVVKHLHFVAWPDFGCPENTAVLLDFVLGVRAHASSQPSPGSGPILVHCSAGVGRTGTFIIVDHLLQHMRTHKTMDIFGLVLTMRNFRCNMIQTEAQYIFAHECIKTAIERQMISSTRSSNAEDEDDECLYQNVSKKDKADDECLYQNFPNNNMHSIQL